ncbi:RAI1 like PD-XK nuclease-domain-containing protein [Clohesyomyces aquaticus]|uniref:Decapping nuclease n=1 Tax=Clohesyomyces aquaticus TaxID=1231657 RepID=A0A1Y1ZI65_9PLEO|nr:RAI1 like PD-XK nuclease-domain-containing protein [Clohesyomyces aquaticus]
MPFPAPRPNREQKPPSAPYIPPSVTQRPADDASPPAWKRPRMDDSRSESQYSIPHTVTSVPSTSQSHPLRFPIQPLHRFQGASATIKRPREIAHFSYDENHEYKEDESGIQYYCKPQMGVDLCEGFDTFNRYEDKEDPHIDSLLRALISKEQREGAKVEADFVTWRGMMTRIMTAPFDMFASFEMFATLHQGTIYIEEDFQAKAAERASENQNPPPNNRRNNYQNNHQSHSHEMMTYWGYKFETLSLSPDPPANTSAAFLQNRRNTVVSNHAQHCSIVHTAFGSNSLFLGGEVDGLWEPKPDISQNPNAPIPWIELKTTELVEHMTDRDILKYERKLLKFWAQSFLLGVTKVIVGFRSKQGILRSIDVYETSQIPGMVRRGSRCWDGNTCINFAAAFLGKLKETITEEGVYKISLRKKAGVIQVWKVKDEGTGGILSEEFVRWRDKGEKDTKNEIDENKEPGEHMPTSLAS